MILVDSDWLIDHFNGHRTAVAYLDSLATEDLAISLISIGEMYEGVLYGNDDPVGAEQRFIEWASQFHLLTLDATTMKFYATHRYRLRREGNSIGENDLYIAATALRYDLPLATRNQRHFARIPEVRLLLSADPAG